MSRTELRSVPALKKEIIRLAVAAAVQVLFALWFYAFCCGLVGLGPLRLPYGVKGYEFGGMVCVLTSFMPIRTVWNLNEAVDEAKKQEPLDFATPCSPGWRKSAAGPSGSFRVCWC